MILRKDSLGKSLFAPEPAPRRWRYGWWVFWLGCLWSLALLLADLPPGLFVPPLIFASLASLLLFPSWIAGTIVGVRAALAGRTWIAVAPTMPWALTGLLIAGTAGTVLGDLPERVALGWARPGLDELLDEAHSLPDELQYLERRRIGPFLADEIRKSPNGRVQLMILGTRLLGVQHGLIWVEREQDLPEGSIYSFDPLDADEESGRGWYRLEREL